MKQERLFLETSSLQLWITSQSKIRLLHAGTTQEFELIEDVIEYISIHPELFSSTEYEEFFDLLQKRNK